MKLNQSNQIRLLFKRHFNSVLHGSETIECTKKHSEYYSDYSDSELRKMGFDDFFIKTKIAYYKIAHKDYDRITLKQFYFIVALLTLNYKSICKQTVVWKYIPYNLRGYL